MSKQEDPLAAFTKPAAPPSWETFGNDNGYGASTFNSPPDAEDYFGDDPLAAYGKAEDGASPQLHAFLLASACSPMYVQPDVLSGCLPISCEEVCTRVRKPPAHMRKCLGMSW